MSETDVVINTPKGVWRLIVAASVKRGHAYFALGSPAGSAGMDMTPAQLDELATSLADLAAELRVEEQL